MSRYVTLLRAVNLAGLNPVGMADLRELASRLGFEDVCSLLQSGNLVFSTGARSTTRLETQLEEAARRRFGFEIGFFVRSADEWRAIVEANPFPAEAKRDPGHLVVVVLKRAPEKGAEAALRHAIVGREVVRVRGREAYVVYPDGQGRSKLTNALIERKLGTRGTGRNWNTVLKLGAAVGG